jgi:plastocyanin
MRPLSLAIAGLALAVALGACGQASGSGAAPSAAASADPNATTIIADGLKFDRSSYTAPAGKPITIAFENKDGAPHNVAIAKDDGFGQKVFEGPIVNGPTTTTYSIGALAAGTYFFRCDVHPDMKGTLVVQ